MKIFLIITLISVLYLVSFQVMATPTGVTPSSLPNWTGTSSINNATSGGAIAIGDFNCDGVNDIIMAASGYSSAKGRIYIQFGSSSFTGSTTLSSSNLDITITGVTSYTDAIGKNIASMDINYDGCDDIISLGGVDTDDIYVYLGDASWSGSYTNGASVYSYMLSTDSTTGSYQYLHLLGPLDGDITGDGVTNDLDRYLAMCDTSSCFLMPVMNLRVSGSIEDLSTYQITNGIAICSAITSGDLDADGTEDLIVGESDDSNGTEGVHVFFGPLSSSSSLQYDLSLTPSNYFEVGKIGGEDITIKDTDSAHEFFSDFVKIDPLIDATYDDLIIGSPNDDTSSSTQAGRYHIISGESIKNFRDTYSSSTGYVICNEDTAGACTTTYGYNYTHLEVFYYTGDTNDAYYGRAYSSSAGDFNGDGLVDLAFGSQSYDSSAGTLHIIYGGSFEDLIGTKVTLGSGKSNSDYFMFGSSGDQLATNVIAGDVTGDGYDDLIVTASGANSGYGAIYLWIGGTTSIYYADTDGDGYGDTDHSIQNKSMPANYVANHSDCNDTDATINPEGAEICGDDVDQNCDEIDLTCGDLDEDGDGYVGTDDCDDTDPTVYPNAEELGDAIDNDCDGNIDEGLVDTTLTYIDDTVTAGDRFAVRVAISNSSGLRDVEIQVLVQSEPTSMGMTSGLGLLKYFSIDNWSCAADAVTGESGCDEVYNVDTIVNNDGVIDTMTFMPEMPTDRTSGNYYVEVRLLSSETGEIISTTATTGSSSGSSAVSPIVHVE